MKIKIGIFGYGNIAKGVEQAVLKNDDMALVAIFTRRNPSEIHTISNAPVYSTNNLIDFIDKIDVMIMCGGSATDLPIQTPAVVKLFNIVDSYDNHSQIPEYYNKINEIAVANNHTAMISIGWDPGIFSIMRTLFGSILPDGATYTFWGKGVSQGHSDAIRRIDGVSDAKQYTIPKEDALEAVRSGNNPELTTRMKHLRECYVVAKAGANQDKITDTIVTMPAYFADYDTIVHYISQEELDRNHNGIPHGGKVIRSGETSNTTKTLLEFGLALDSNPEFTSSVLVAYARACFRMFTNKTYGAQTVVDVPLKYLSSKSNCDIRRELI